jgi:hypothetical protein
MPITYQLIPADSLVNCSATGSVSFDELQALQAKLNSYPAFTFKDRARMLWDFTAVTRFDHSVTKMAQVAESWLVSAKTRRAVVAKPNTEAGKFMTLWVLHRIARQDPFVQNFATVEQARHWLDHAA